MARTARITAGGIPLHVIQRGNNRARVFVDARDHMAYRKAMFAAAEKAGCAVHSYVLMSNHVHILLTPLRADAAAEMMRRLGATYVRRFNDRHARTGTLWDGRFRSTLIDSEHYFFACSRYIELNPVHAGLAREPAAYPWSSYRHNALGRSEPALIPHDLYQGLARSPSARCDAYRALFDEPLAPETLQALRGGQVAGDAEFRINMERRLRRSLRPASHGGDRKSGRFRETTVRSHRLGA